MYKVETNLEGLRMTQNLHDTLAMYQHMFAKYKSSEFLAKIVKSYNLVFALFDLLR